MKGHFAKAGTTPKKNVVEFRDFREEFEGQVALGNEINVADIFEEGDFVDAIGTSKGKGFQGVVKRHGLWWCWSSDSRSAQQIESSWFYWWCFISCSCIQRYAYGR